MTFCNIIIRGLSLQTMQRPSSKGAPLAHHMELGKEHHHMLLGMPTFHHALELWGCCQGRYRRRLAGTGRWA